MWFVYILLCEDGTFYTGCTNNIEKRYRAHMNGRASYYTKSRGVECLVYKESATDRSAAQKREAQIKKLTRAEKEGLIKFANLKPQTFEA